MTDPTEAAGPHPGGDVSRALGAMVSGALLAAVLEIAAGFLLDQVARRGGSAAYSQGYRAFLGAGGWLWIPLWGAALAGLRAAAWAATTRRCALVIAISGALAVLPFGLRPVVIENPGSTPVTTRAKTQAILKWSYRSPETVARILDLSRDPDAGVREHAVLALGVNLIVTDIERADAARPARYAGHPLRGRLRARLVEALRADPDPAVRAEAARALWKSPITFGLEPAAAETLARVLDRARADGTVERLAWLALDAAAGMPHRELKLAAARFAAATPDSELASAARLAAASPP